MKHKPHITCNLYLGVRVVGIWVDMSQMELCFAPAGNLRLHFHQKCINTVNAFHLVPSCPVRTYTHSITTYFLTFLPVAISLNINDLSWSWCCSRWSSVKWSVSGIGGSGGVRTYGVLVGWFWNWDTPWLECSPPSLLPCYTSSTRGIALESHGLFTQAVPYQPE